MSDPNAAGRKTDGPSFVGGQAESLLEKQIAALGEHIVFCLEQNREIDGSTDGYGHARAAGVSNAIALAKTSVKLALAIGKMQGELNYNFNYNHLQGATPSARRPVWDIEHASPEELRMLPLEDLPRNIPAALAERRRRERERIAVEERAQSGEPMGDFE
jgi:hypothetical protein